MLVLHVLSCPVLKVKQEEKESLEKSCSDLLSNNKILTSCVTEQRLLGAVLSLGGHLAMSGDISEGHNSGRREELLASRGEARECSQTSCPPDSSPPPPHQ